MPKGTERKVKHMARKRKARRGLCGLEGECVSEAAGRAYHALQVAAERIGMNNARAGRYKVRRRGHRVTAGYSITSEHKQLVEAMPLVCSGKISPEEGMALLHDYDVFAQRFPKGKRGR